MEKCDKVRKSAETILRFSCCPFFLRSKSWEVKRIYHHHHPESKKRESPEWNSGSILPYGRYGMLENQAKTISTIAILWPVKGIFGTRAAAVEVDTLISPVQDCTRLHWRARLLKDRFLTRSNTLAAQCEIHPHIAQYPFEIVSQRGVSHVFIGYRSSIAEIPFWGGGASHFACCPQGKRSEKGEGVSHPIGLVETPRTP